MTAAPPSRAIPRAPSSIRDAHAGRPGGLYVELQGFIQDYKLYGTGRHAPGSGARQAGLGIDNLGNEKYWAFHPYPQRTFHAELKFDL